MLTIAWTEHFINDEVLERIEIKCTQHQKATDETVRHIMRNNGLENVIVTKRSEVNLVKGKQSITFFPRLNKKMIEMDIGEITKIEIYYELEMTRKYVDQ